MDRVRPKWIKWTNRAEMDRINQNGLNKTKVDKMDRIWPNRTKVDWILPKWTDMTEYDQSGLNGPRWTE